MLDRTPRSARPKLPRDWTPVQRFQCRRDRAVPALSGPPRLTFAVSGGAFRVCFVPSPPPVLTPEACLSAGCPSPRSSHLPDCTRIRTRMHLSWGSCPLQRSTTGGARIPRWRCKATGTLRPQGFSPSRRLSSPSALPETHSPLSGAASSDCAPGVPPDPWARTALASGQGRPTTGFLSKALPNPATSAFYARSPLLRFSVLSAPPLSKGVTAGAAGASEFRSQDCRRFPQWRTASAGLPEVSGLTSHSRVRAVYSSPGLPRRIPGASPLPSCNHRDFRDPASFEAPLA